MNDMIREVYAEEHGRQELGHVLRTANRGLDEAQRHAEHAVHFHEELARYAHVEDVADEVLVRLVDTVVAHTVAATKAADRVDAGQRRNGVALYGEHARAAYAWANVAVEAMNDAESWRPRTEEEADYYWRMREADAGMGETPTPEWARRGYDGPEEWARHLTREAKAEVAP